jgi:hypothetical protein
MPSTDSVDRRVAAAAKLNSHEQREDGEVIVNSLYYGMTTLRNLLFTRVCDDVQRLVGRDSIMMPLSPEKSEERTKLEIGLFEVAVSIVQVQRGSYVRDAAWYGDWLARLLLGDRANRSSRRERIARYVKMNDEGRRLGFSRVLEKTYPEATRAPLILYRLFPVAVGIVTAAAWNDLDQVAQLRKQQENDLPPIRDCQSCRGRPLDNGEQCETCGNPLWTYAWLTAAD